MKKKIKNLPAIKSMLIMLLIGFAAITLAAVPAVADCTMNADTNVTVNPDLSSKNNRSIHDMNWGAQTFTVIGSGCFMLEKVTFNIKQHGTAHNNLTVQIRNVVGGVPGDDVRAEKTVPKDNVPIDYTNIEVVIDPPIQIAGGVQYALVVSTTFGNANNGYRLGLAGGNPYDGGQYCRYQKDDDTNYWDCSIGGVMADVSMSICVSACASEGCVYGMGFWKNHTNDWPVDELGLGNFTYKADELLKILNESVRGNGLVSLSYHLIAAKLNQENGAPVPTGVQDAINSADTTIGERLIPPIGSGSLAPRDTENLKNTLEQYNEGLYSGGPSKCSDADDESIN